MNRAQGILIYRDTPPFIPLIMADLWIPVWQVRRPHGPPCYVIFPESGSGTPESDVGLEPNNQPLGPGRLGIDIRNTATNELPRPGVDLCQMIDALVMT